MCGRPDDRQERYIRTLQPEFTPTPHDRGIVSMARGDDPASATSSFFIVLARTPALDGRYSVFGKVVAGPSGSLSLASTATRIEVLKTRVEP